MKLISSKNSKRRIALLFVFAFMLSNLLSLFGPSAKAAVSVTAPSAGTCFQHSGTVANGALVTVYSIGQITIAALVNDIQPGQDDAGGAGAGSTGGARATLAGSISTAADARGNVVSIVPPTGTNFVIVPGFQDTANGNGTGSGNQLLPANATITNAQSTDNSITAGPDSNLGISVGVITAGTAGLGRAIIAIARDADTTGVNNAGTESYPKSGTGNNTTTITINGLGVAVPPSGNVSLTGTLTASFDSTPPSGIGTATVNGTGGTAIISAIPSIGGTINVCTVTSPGGQLEAVLDTDDDVSDLYDKTAASANLLALGQIGTATRVHAVDNATTTTATTIAGDSGAIADLEPILIRGKAGTGTATRDQVFSTGKLVTDIDAAAEAPGAAGLNISDSTLFTNTVTTPITITFSDNNASAASTLEQVSVLIENTTGGSTPAQAGFAAGQTSRFGFLGALRAAFHQGTNAASAALAVDASKWGVASVTGGPGTVAIQESHIAGTTDTNGVAAFGGVASAVGIGAAIEPFNSALLELRIYCTSTNPVAGWFATLNSNTSASFGTTTASFCRIAKSQAGNSVLVNNNTQTFFSQSLTNITGTTGTTGLDTNAFTWRAGNALTDTDTPDNALLYASCASNTLTIVPIQNGFDATKDILAVSPRLDITNVSNTFSSDVSVIAELSGNNLSGTTQLTLTKLVGVPPTGQDSTLAAAQGVGIATNSELAVDCGDGSGTSVVLGSVTSGTVDTQVTAACTSGGIAPASPLFIGGANNSVSGTTVIDGSPVIQGESRGILVKELTATGFSELVSQVGGGTQGAVFEVTLPSGCDVVDDQDDNNTASSTSATAGSLGGNDVTRLTATSTAGIGVHFSGGTGDALVTNVNSLESVSGANPSKIHFGLTMASGTSTDAVTTDALLIRLDAQDLLCDSNVVEGTELEAKVFCQNKVSSPTIVANLGKAKIGKAAKALKFSFADDVVKSTKGEESTNTMIGATPRQTGKGETTSHPFVVEELDAKGIAIGGRVASRNIDPENNLLTTTITRGQIWVVPAVGSSFTTAPMATDVTFSDNSLESDGAPFIATSATVDANAPLGTLVIGVKKGTATGAADPAKSTTKVTVRNAKLAAATSSTTDLVGSVEFFSQDVGALVNAPGAASANSASTPTVFTPYVQGGTKARTQLEVAAVQIGSGSSANQLLTSRLTTLGTPQLNPFATVLTTAKNADAAKISLSAAAVGMDVTPATDNVVTVTGTAGAVDNGAEVVVTTGGATAYDSTTVVSSNDGAFTAKLRGDCASSTNIAVTVTEQVSGSKTTSVSKTVLCGGSTGGGDTEDSVFSAIAGSDGAATIDEVLTYISAQGGLASVVSSGGGKLAGVIKAAKSALGLS